MEANQKVVKFKNKTPYIANDNEPIFGGRFCIECGKVVPPTILCVECGHRLGES